MNLKARDVMAKVGVETAVAQRSWGARLLYSLVVRRPLGERVPLGQVSISSHEVSAKV